MLAKAKQQKQWLSFDDLLTQLSASGDVDEQSLLVGKFEPYTQWRWSVEFRMVLRCNAVFLARSLDNPQCACLWSGDPKQAIYGFRGADIFTYIKGRETKLVLTFYARD